MNSKKINEWLTLIANIAVVGGIVFLAIELRQNNELLRSESRQALIANDVTSLTANIDNADVFALYLSGAPLSAEDQLRLSFMYMLDLRNREFEYFQYKNGLLDEETWLAYRNVILINHSAGHGRTWWDEIGKNVVDPEFGRLVDEMLVDAEPDRTYELMSTWAGPADDSLSLFAVEITVGPNWDSDKAPNEQAYFQEHSKNLRQLRDAGLIVLGARYSDVGLIIFSAKSADEVHGLMDRDPAMDAGTFQYEVHPFNAFYPGTVRN